MGMGSTENHGIRCFVLPAGMEYLRPVGVMTQELCRHLQRCLKHEDVARQLTLLDLHLACEQWACDSLRELTEEMEMWKWDDTLDNKWARVAMPYQHARRHQGRAARYELGEGNTRAEAIAA